MSRKSKQKYYSIFLASRSGQPKAGHAGLQERLLDYNAYLRRNMYNRKKVEWNHKREEYIYKHPVLNDEDRGVKKSDKPPVHRKQYSEMNMKEQQESDKRRIRYYKSKVAYLTDLAIHNNLDSFVTLTFKDEVTEYEEAKQAWGLFVKRMRYVFGDDVKYIATYELQKRRVYHFHMLTNIGYVEHDILSQIWQNGFVFIEGVKMQSPEERRRQIGYIFKYIVKDILEGEENGQRCRHRKIYCSRNLSKPFEVRMLSDENTDDIIFDNMDNIAKTFRYDMRNFQGTKINEVDVVEIKKKGNGV